MNMYSFLLYEKVLISCSHPEHESRLPTLTLLPALPYLKVVSCFRMLL